MVCDDQTDLVFPYGINPRTTVTVATNGASVSWANGTIISITGNTPPQSFAGLQGQLPVIFAGAEEVCATFTASFSTVPVAGTIQVVGYGDTEYGIFVGYNGTQQGVCIAQGGLMQYYSLTLSGSVTLGGTLTVNLNQTPFTITVPAGASVQDVVNLLQTSTSIAAGNYFVRQFGAGVHIWSIGALPMTAPPSASITGAGMTATMTVLQNGVIGSQQWIYPAQWNGNISNIAPINWTQMNTFKLRVSALGYGSITWSILDPVSQTECVIHKLSAVNAALPVTLPTGLTPACLTTNGTNNNVMQVTSSGFSATGGSLFKVAAKAPPYSISTVAQQSLPLNVSSNLMYVHNPVITGALRNHKNLVLQHAVISVTSNNSVFIEIRQNPQVSKAPVLSQPPQLAAGSVAYTNFDNSINVSNGLVLRSIPFISAIPASGGLLSGATATPVTQQLLVPFENIFMPPSSWLTVSVLAISGTTLCSVGLELTWTER